MKLVLLDMPENPEALAAWLERQLVGRDLRALVSELAAVHGGPTDADSLEQALAGKLEAVLERGLAELPSETLRRLLTRPLWLFDLQQRIFMAESAHWIALTDSGELEAAAARGRTRLQAALKSNVQVAPAPGQVERHEPRSSAGLWLSFAALAACIALAVFQPWHWINRSADENPKIGWGRTDALADAADGKTYLNQLAKTAVEFLPANGKESAAELARRLAGIRAGCAKIQVAEHKPLTKPDRDWLIDHCRIWDGKFAALQFKLKDGGSVAEIGGETDAIVRQLIKALEERAQAAA
jgi:hypothetical protein